PVYIYNPSRVYVGVIGDSQRNSRRSLRGRADPAPANDDLEGGLRYPQEEQCPPSQWEPSRTPEQESGKESHLPESASD
ncbi:hypothetical protein chiPu_0026895, partial [Chiloscyllium punctatum]|nr:hypothetical protein [Chiloscyllium punctatum]